MRRLSQRTLVRMMEVLGEAKGLTNFSRLLYEKDFPDWFVLRASSEYHFYWDRILVSLRNQAFFYPDPGYFGDRMTSITGKYLTERNAQDLGEQFIQRLAVLAATLDNGGRVANSLELDGYSVNTEKLCLTPLEGVVQAEAEADALTTRINGAGLPNSQTTLQHLTDAKNLFGEGKHHPSLNESRSFLQSLFDNISTDTENSGAHPAKLPGGTTNRIRYLREVGFLTTDEEASCNSAWSALSAGSHPGVPERDEARIGLILALEFGQLLLLKYENWKANGYKKFSR
jgi:hypothetical protein